MKRILYIVFAVGHTLSSQYSSTGVVAAIIPPNLPPGSQYQLIFVTAGTRDATSGTISGYNTFVAAQAALNPSLPRGVTWRAVGSTSNINANLNAPSLDLPVYNTQGVEVVSAKTGLYSSSLMNPITFDQFGNPTSSGVDVWTATYGGGTGDPIWCLGQRLVR